MKARPLLVLLIFLILLGLTPWTPPLGAWMWKLSVVICCLGQWLCAVSVLVALTLLFAQRKSQRKSQRESQRESKWRGYRWSVLQLGFWAAAFLLALPTISALSVAQRARLELSVFAGQSEPPIRLHFADLWWRKKPESRAVRTLSYKAADGTSFDADFFPPTSTAPAPWIVIVHGGGWQGGHRQDMPEFSEELAAQGFGVISVDYRLSPAVKWPTAQDDVRSAIDFVRANATELHLDPQRWAILGRSAGGQIAGSIAYSYHDQSGPKALITYYAPTDLLLGYEAAEEHDLIESRQLLRDYLGGAPAVDTLPAYHGGSMVDAISRDSCPTLILQGRTDTVVWFKHAERLQRRLAWQKRPSITLLFDLGPHGFDFFPTGPEAQIANQSIAYFLKATL